MYQVTIGIEQPKSINVQSGGRLRSFEMFKKDTSKEMVSEMQLKDGWDSKEWMCTTVVGGQNLKPTEVKQKAMELECLEEGESKNSSFPLWLPDRSRGGITYMEY